jgi:hypothetical protein
MPRCLAASVILYFFPFMLSPYTQLFAGRATQEFLGYFRKPRHGHRAGTREKTLALQVVLMAQLIGHQEISL